jgi:hypothetical protein
VTGTVLREPEAQQQTDYRTKVPETWKDGSPKMMVVVQLATAERDPEKPDDDGTRALYIAGQEPHQGRPRRRPRIGRQRHPHRRHADRPVRRRRA